MIFTHHHANGRSHIRVVAAFADWRFLRAALRRCAYTHYLAMLRFAHNFFSKNSRFKSK